MEKGKAFKFIFDKRPPPIFFGVLIMSYGNPFNHLIQNVKESFLNRDLVSTSKPQYDDDVIECMQFGICSSNRHRMNATPYFHF